MKTPESIYPYRGKYKDHSWEDYTPEELGMWVHLFIKRAYHRTQKEKIEKDLTDAQNYLNMMQEHINSAKERLL